MILSVARARIVLFAVAAYVILNLGFMLVRFPPGGEFGIPTAELLVLLFAMTFLFDLRRWSGFIRVAPLVPLLIWWVLGSVQVLNGLQQNGFWALRDASHLIDSFFLWIGFVVAASPGFFERFTRWLRVVLNIGAVYGLLFPFRETLAQYSPKITAPAGYSTALFFNYIATSVVPLTAAMAWLVDRKRHFLLPAVVLAGGLIIYTVVIFQARSTYLQVMALLLVFSFLRPQDAARMIFGMLIGAAALAFALAAGVEITGRLGEEFSLDFVIQHFASITGSTGEGAVASAADGIGLRLRWWTLIWNDLTSSIGSFIFGLGYGFPLTDFHTPDEAIVREPHNSLISLLARQGVAGLLAFLCVQLSLLRTWFRVYRECEHAGIPVWRQNLLIMGTFFMMVAILSIGEDAFEKPFNSVPYYFFWGIILRLEFVLRARQMADAGQQAATPAYGPYDAVPERNTAGAPRGLAR